MSRKARSQRQRAPQRQGGDGRGRGPSSPSPSPSRAAGRARREADPMAVYRGLASPSPRVRWILVLGLLLFTAAQLVSVYASKALDAQQALAVAGVVCISVFLGSGFIRHYRALYRIRRDSPDAWQPTMRFAVASLAVPLGFGGPPADAGERRLRRVTLVALLVFAASAILGSSHH
jgi:hypothetical protein